MSTASMPWTCIKSWSCLEITLHTLPFSVRQGPVSKNSRCIYTALEGAIRRTYPRDTAVSGVLREGVHDGVAKAYRKGAGRQIIEQEYNLQLINRTTHLEFDGWVLTHWDRDHDFAFLYLILPDLQAKKRMKISPCHVPSAIKARRNS